MKQILILILLIGLVLTITGCGDDAQVASYNLVRSADNFEINRRVVFFNGITDNYLLEIEGKCSIKTDTYESQLEVISKTGEGKYKKNFLGIFENIF